MAINLVVNNADATVEPGSRLDYALRYAALGWHVFPAYPIKDGVCLCGSAECKSPGKHPLSEAAPFGQSQATTDKAQITKWWQRHPQANIAVLLAKSNLCAIDIDPRNGGHYTIDELESKHGALQADVLAFTGGGGEHRVFELPTGMNLPGKLGKGIDVKVNGYIVVEPSNHISGGVYEWEASSNPLEGAIPSPLPDWLRDLARVVHVVDDAVAASSKQITEAELAEISAALPFIDADDRQTWLDVGMALHSDVGGSLGFDLWSNWSMTSHKFKQSDQLRVWRSFKSKGISGITKATLFKLAMDGGWFNAGHIDEIEPQAVEVIEAVIQKVSVEKAAKKTFHAQTELPVKRLQDVADWFSGLYDSPTPEISTAGAIALGSVVTGRLYRSTLANWTSLLMAVSGSSGVGKNYIKVGVERILLRADQSNLIAGDFYTHQAAIYSELRRKPSHICISDEFGENFMEARKNNNANKMTVFKSFKKAYSDADHIYKSESYSMMSGKKDIDTTPIEKPSLTLLGLTTPLQFYSEIKTSHIESGLMNRFIVINVDDGSHIERALGNTEPSDDLIEWLKSVRRLNEPLRHSAFNMQPDHVVVDFTPQAIVLFDQAKKDQNAIAEKLAADHMDVMPRRWRENSMRMATMLAACENPLRPIINADLAQWAINYVFHHGQRVIDVLMSGTGENDYQVQSNAVLEFIRANPEGVQDQALSRKFRSLKKRDRVEILAHLQEAELVYGQKEASTGAARGRDCMIWRAF